ncbi:hypothetical protein [Aquirufa sp. OSTEICH-129A]
MAYITNANSKKMIGLINLKEVGEIEGEVYKKPIYFLNKNEITYLKSMQTLLKDPEKFAFEIYKPIVKKDTFQYVYESLQPPCYHDKDNCPRLQSSYKNFEIPSEIKERVRQKAEEEGKSEAEILILIEKQVAIFRKWFKEHYNLFLLDTKEFLRQLDIRWNIQRNLKEVEKENTGIDSVKNLDLAKLENEIDKIISAAGQYFNQHKDRQHIIRRFQKLTFLAYKKSSLEIMNDTELSDDELRAFLIEYELKFKKPIKELLIHYYRVKYNSELSFDGKLLERLNFKPCSVCYEDYLEVGI